MTADPEIPVPPRYYGGIERIVDMLARGRAAGRHQVPLFSHRLSQTTSRLAVHWKSRVCTWLLCVGVDRIGTGRGESHTGIVLTASE